MTPLEGLRALGTGEEAPAQAKERVYSALLTSLEGAATAAAAGAPALPQPVATVPPATVAVVASITSSKTLSIALGIWLLGGVTGAALYGALRPPRVQVVYVDRPTPSRAIEPPTTPQVTTDASSVAVRSLSAAPAPVVSVPSVVTSTSPSNAGLGSELARERALLDLARAAAAHGEPAAALERAEQHRQQFPHGHLTEEREALTIRALLTLGRTREAQQRVQTFRNAYPGSFLLPVIDSALSAAIPSSVATDPSEAVTPK